MEYWVSEFPSLQHSIAPLLQLQFAYFFAGAGFLPMAASNSLYGTMRP